jgi:hypothetical protein
MPADATIVPLRSDTPEALAARRETQTSNRSGHQENNRSSLHESSRCDRSRGPRSLKRHRNLPPDAGCAGRCLHCYRSR